MSSEQAAELLATAWRRWRSSSPVGRGRITQEQYWILRRLKESGPMRVKDVAESIGCTPGSASVAIKRLERSGMVTRERSSEDERVVTVSIARKASADLEGWRAGQLGSLAGLLENLEESERKDLVRLLTKALAPNGAMGEPRRKQERRAR